MRRIAPAILVALALLPLASAALPPQHVTAAGTAEHSWRDLALFGTCSGPAATSVVVAGAVMRIAVAGAECPPNLMGFTVCQHTADGAVSCYEATAMTVRSASLQPDGAFRYESRSSTGATQLLHGVLTRVG